MASGVGFLARGYCFKSRLSRDKGGRTNSGGYDRFVVVVVVTIFVSTHSARSIWNVDVSRPSRLPGCSQAKSSRRSGVTYPSACESSRPAAADFDMEGMDDGSAAIWFAGSRVALWVDVAWRVVDGHTGGSISRGQGS